MDHRKGVEVWNKDERDHEDRFFRIQFFNRDEVESNVMEEGVMCQNVKLMLLELIE